MFFVACSNDDVSEPNSNLLGSADTYSSTTDDTTKDDSESNTNTDANISPDMSDDTESDSDSTGDDHDTTVNNIIQGEQSVVDKEQGWD